MIYSSVGELNMTPIISLTTIPSRIDHIELCVKSLVAQGFPVHLWVVKQELFRKGKAMLRSVPQALLDSGAIIEIVEDRGPITKLLPAFEAKHDFVITADDDHTYGPGWAQGLVEWSEKRPGVVVCYRGRNLAKNVPYNASKVVTLVNKPVNFITGVSGVLYSRYFFDRHIFEEWKQWPLNDDIVICSHLKRRKIPIEVVPFPEGCGLTRLPATKISPLYSGNVHHQMNDEGLRKMFWK